MSSVGNYHIEAQPVWPARTLHRLAANIGPKSALKDEHRLIQEPAVALSWR
jgi:hypothetical protein